MQSTGHTQLYPDRVLGGALGAKCSGEKRAHRLAEPIGTAATLELGNDVTIEVPTWQDLRPDGRTIEGEGIAPDVLVP